VQIGLQEGAELLIGGGRPHLDGRLEHGYFFQPTVFKGTNDLRIFQEEIFGLTATAHAVPGTLRQEVLVDGRHRLVTDEPVRLGGDGSAPAPHELLPAALAACISTTLVLELLEKVAAACPFAARSRPGSSSRSRSRRP
jgi:hypothetical protein